MIEEGFYYTAGKVRNVPVSIGGTKWTPGLPIESVIPAELTGEFKDLLILYYEGKDDKKIKKFIKEKCYMEI